MAVLRRPAISLTTAVSLLLAICPGLQADSGTIPVTLHTRAGVAGIDWPLTFGVPFPEGVLTNDANVRLLDPCGTEVIGENSPGRSRARFGVIRRQAYVKPFK